MAQSYKDYIKSLKPGLTTPVVAPAPFNPYGTYKAPSTSNSGSTTAVPKKTGTQIVQQAVKGIAPQSTNIAAPRIVAQNNPLGVFSNSQPQNTAYSNSTPSIGTPVSAIATSPMGQSAAPANIASPAYWSQQPKTISSGESINIANTYGLKGIGSGTDYSGLTQGQAKAEAKAKQDFYKTQTSENTSYTFNPESVSKFSSTVADMKGKLNTTNSGAWKSPQEKKMESESTLKSFTGQFSTMFNNIGEFQNSIATSPEMQTTLKDYQRLGGKVSDIEAALAKKSGLGVVSYQDNTDGTTTHTLSDGTKETGNLVMQPNGEYKFEGRSDTVQRIDQYLGRRSTPSEQKAYESLVPEQKAYQDQIAFEQSIPQQYKDAYFGTPEKMGIIEQKKNEAIARADLLQKKADTEKENARASSALLIQKNEAELDAEEATIEENRMSANNYMTGMLAKMGALNTTGAAGEALVNLDFKYQRQAQQLRAKYKLENRGIEVKLNESLTKSEYERDDAILKVKEDLSKSQEEVIKEVSKIQTESGRNIFKVVDKYLGEYRTQKEKFIKEAKAEAEKNAKKKAAVLSTMGNINTTRFLLSDFYSKAYAAGIPTPMIGAKKANPYTGTDASIPKFLQTLASNNKVSPDLQAVIEGDSKLSDYTPTNRTKIQRELTKLGVSKSDLPGDAKKVDEVGGLSSSDLTTGINYILTNGGTDTDIERFKTNRKDQAYIMSKAK